jgi:hypothetical protein
VAGYIPLFPSAPERYLFYHNNFNEYQSWTRWLFISAKLLLLYYYGAWIAKVAEELKGMYTYVGSDVHHDKHIEAFSQKISLKDTTHFKKLLPIINFSKVILSFLNKKKDPKAILWVFFFKKACYLSNNSKVEFILLNSGTICFIFCNLIVVKVISNTD